MARKKNKRVDDFVEFPEVCSGVGRGDDFLDPSRVEFTGKRFIFCFANTTNRKR